MTDILSIRQQQGFLILQETDYYIEKREAVEGAANLSVNNIEEKPAEVSDSKQEWIENKNAQAQKKKITNALNKCEKEIEKIEEKLGLIDEEFANPEISSNVGKLMELQKEKTALEEKLEKLMNEWEELTLSLEEN